MNHDTVRDRLDELEGKDALRRLLAKDDEDLSWADMAWLLQIPAVVGLAIHIAFMAMTASSTAMAPSREDLAWLVLLALVVAVLHFGGPLLRSRGERLRRRLRRQGDVLPVALVQANDGWFADDNQEWLPGSILVSADPRAKSEPERLLVAARRVSALRKADRRTLPAAEAALAWDLYHEMWMLPSSPVPAELSEGLRDCLVATVMLPPQPLRDGDLLMALVLPGEKSPDAVRVLPHEVAAAADQQERS